MAKYATEFLGTFFLVLTIGLTVITGAPMPALAIGASLMVMVYMGGHVSGAHYNPAVSLAVLLRGKLPAGEFVPYVCAQLLGALAAAFCVYYITGRTVAPAPGETTSALQALMVETLYTFALSLTVLNVATAKATAGNSFYGLAIGFAVAVAAFAGGRISGGAYNPAVGVGLVLVNALFGAGNFSWLWLYLAGPLLGGVIAAQVFKIQNPAD
jgi:aquaporin Z